MTNFLIPKKANVRPLRRQGGAVLAIALILLVVVTLLGLSSIKTVGQQEKMVSHSNDRSLAYQFAEAALREGEAQARIQSLNGNASFPTSQYISDNNCIAGSVTDCANGLCATPDPDCPPRWTTPGFNRWTSYNGVAAVTSATGNTLSGTPQYFIEIMRPTDTVCVPGADPFDTACNQRYPDPDDTANPPRMCAPSGAAMANPPYNNAAQYQNCNYYRYRITARVVVIDPITGLPMQDRATVVLQSVLSVQPN